MDRLSLDDSELKAIGRLLDSVSARYRSVTDPRFLLDAPVLAHDLPIRIRRFLNDFRREEPGAAIIAGQLAAEGHPGPTPVHWNAFPDTSPSLRHEMLLVLYTSLLGDIIGWATQQDGRLVHDVLPIRGHEQEQLGSGSETLLTWHTEDAFHHYRSDYVVLSCLRNPYQAATTVGNIDDIRLDPADVDVLFQERFIIRPDQSHLARNNSPGSGGSFAAIDELNDSPEPVAVLFGAPDRPYVRADPYFMEVAAGDTAAAAALARFCTAMDEQIKDVVLVPGEYCFLDNLKVVHGRRPFHARFDGSDRWLKRVCVARDLRKSRDSRTGLLSQVIA
jgi:Fe(II)/alpha-ketoglutarate-dependent arginine beta-hydroxylase